MLKINKEEDKIPNSERLFQGTVQEQVSIARIFKKHIEIDWDHVTPIVWIILIWK